MKLGIAEMSQRSDTSKNNALQATGRTIVNFQRLEHNLKELARLGPMNGTAQKIQKDVAKANERASSFTLGAAIQAWLKNCSDLPENFNSTPDLFDISFRTTLSFGLDAASFERHAKALKDLLEIRNDLIHSRFVKFDWASVQSCRDLVAELDAVNSAIAEQLEYTGNLLATIAELLNEHASAIAAEFGLAAPPQKGAMPNTSLERTRES